MANFFIAVGGTGQNVALAYCRLAKLCGFEPASIYVMDSDRSITRNYPSFIPLMPIPTTPCVKPFQMTSFRKLYNPGGDIDIDSMLSILFTNHELNTPIDQGMFGRPSVGSAAIMDKIDLMDRDLSSQGACRRADAEFDTLIQQLQQGGNHKVVICGSSMGGTGAGGVPTIAKYIADKAGINRARIEIVIIYFLTHFSLPLTPGTEDAITNEKLTSNSESGMCYLADKIADQVDACVLLGLPEPISLPYREAQNQIEVVPFENGSNSESNSEGTFLYALAAIIGNNTFHGDLSKLFPNGPGSIYSYWIPCKDNSTASSLKVADIDVYMPTSKVIIFDNILKLAGAATDFLEIFSKYIHPLPKYSFVPPMVVPQPLRRSLDSIVNATRESEQHVCKKIIDYTKAKQRDITNHREWFLRLLRKECDLFPNKSLATILSSDNDERSVTIGGELYEKTKRQPMDFIRAWIKATKWTNPKEAKDFVDPLTVALRKTLNEKLFNGHFGDMGWLN